MLGLERIGQESEAAYTSQRDWGEGALSRGFWHECVGDLWEQVQKSVQVRDRSVRGWGVNG